MKWFNNQKILTKTLLLLGMLGLVVIFGTVFSTSKMNMIDDDYLAVLNGPGVAGLKLSNANKAVTQVGLGIGDLMMSTSDEGNKKANALREGAMTEFNQDMKDAAAAMPAKQKEIEELAGKLKLVVDQNCKEALRMGTAATTLETDAAAQAEFLKNCQPTLEPVLVAIQSLASDIVAQRQKQIDATHASVKSIISFTVMFIAIGLVAVMGLAVFLTNTGINTPVKKIAAVLAKLAQNNLAVEITGTDRKDEIGDFARTAEDFKAVLLTSNQYVGQIMALGKTQGIIEFNMDGTVITANENFLKALGYSSLDEIKGRNHSMFVDAAYRETSEYKLFWQNLNRGESQIAEFKRISKTGKDVYIQGSYCPILDENGKPIKVVKFSIDLTEAKLAEFARAAAEKKDIAEKEARTNRMSQLVAEFDTNATQTVAAVAAASTELAQTAEHMSHIAADANRQSTEVASASQQASQNVQTVASAAEEMAATVQEISRQVSLSNDTVREAMKKAETADASSRELVEMSSAVGAIADLIENIAGQINLLALNATIESARAGEAGKGFAVVANEVKNLATQTTKATEQIRTQLDGVQKTAVNVAEILGSVKESIGKVSESSTTIAAAVEEQSAATHEIVSNMSTATLGVEQINKGIFSIKSGTESTSQSTGEVLDAAKMLSQQAERMDAEIKSFLRNIQTA